MKLMEASAVFLIIGGVLLGPIEAKCTTGGVFGAAQCRGWEPTAQTCARAMREIGANRKHRIEGGQRVLCIPAPSGLMR